MAVVKMKKFTLLTFPRHKERLLKDLQRFEDVHFKSLEADEDSGLRADSSEDKARQIEAWLSQVNFALAKTKPYSNAPTGIKAMRMPPKSMNYAEFDTFTATYDYKAVCAALKSLDEGMNAIKSETARLKAENEALRPWQKLNVSPEEFDRWKYAKGAVGAVNKASVDSLREGLLSSYPGSYFEVVGQIKEDATVFVVVHSADYDEASAFMKGMGFSRVQLGFKGVAANVIKQNDARVATLQKELGELEKKVAAMGDEHDKLMIVSDYLETELARELATENFLVSRMTFMAEGWVPEAESRTLASIVKAACGDEAHLELNEVDKDSLEVPVKLKNGKLVSVFENITAMFSMPRYNEMDPTPLLMPFYIISFGLMVGDLIYGAVVTLATILSLKLFHLKESMVRFMKFFLYLGIATMLGGVVYGGGAGFTFIRPLTNAYGESVPILDTELGVINMLLFSVAIGVVQILFGICVKAYALIKEGNALAAIFDAGFLFLAVVSGIMWLLGGVGVLSRTLMFIGIVGFAVAVLGIALTQGRHSPTIAGKIGNGLNSVYGLTGFVGDFVSYTRIAAMALAGAYIGFSFNLMASLIPGDGVFIIVRIIFGGAIALVGHLLNMGLALLGGYVHSMRLQYVEYFGKFFEGGGVPFDAFKLKNKYININK